MVQWRCAEGHTWNATVKNRALRNSGCGTCQRARASAKKRQPSPGASFADLHPDLARDWHPTMNAPLSPSDINPTTHDKYWWVCTGCAQPTSASAARKVAGLKSCGVCNNKRVVQGVNDLASQFPGLLDEWDYVKNAASPSETFCRTSDSVWWRCRTCGHSWAATVGGRVHAKGKGCLACSKRGFDQFGRGVVYFLKHPLLNAYKVGITGSNDRRIQAFAGQGWTLVFREDFARGADALEVETAVHRWWRKDLNLPVWLAFSDIGKLGGHTETICADELSEFEVISRIKAEAKRVLAGREALSENTAAAA
ncbi:zinc-ribbon domain-containing protein (plasmid) [Curtobacterium sp. MCSS17_016]|nr:zinc-ribbon domain-containing protein [Curtobacterium sp. MCSS17_016]WIE81553.1 zinc-ribbon domain-containing protein [Curtobacterium sp. MCSS17_016]